MERLTSDHRKQKKKKKRLSVRERRGGGHTLEKVRGGLTSVVYADRLRRRHSERCPWSVKARSRDPRWVASRGEGGV